MQDGQFSKSSFFSNICCNLKVFFEHNKGNVAFFASSGQFHFFKDYALIFPKAHSFCKIVPKPNIGEMIAFWKSAIMQKAIAHAKSSLWVKN